MQSVMLCQMRSRQTMMEVRASIPVRVRTLQTRPLLPLLLVVTRLGHLFVISIIVRSRPLRDDQPRRDCKLSARRGELARIAEFVRAR